jgi:hypothetical protein
VTIGQPDAGCAIGRLRLAAILVLLLVAPPAIARAGDQSPAPPAMPGFDTRYYLIYSDLPEDAVREAAVRMTHMAEEYRARTADFSGEIREKMPFYLFSTAAKYYAAGGRQGTAGFYNGVALMAVAGRQFNGGTWHIVQHEGFHQFAAAVISRDLPIWVNEGLAEYFGEAVYTGDSFVSGVIPGWRMMRLRDEMDKGKLMNVQDMTRLSHEQWNAQLSLANYDLAWSMVQFLAHGENGRYQRAFGRYMWLLSHNTPPNEAWAQTFGDSRGFQQNWEAYWRGLPDEPTSDLYAKAVTATLTSFLARSALQHQTFGSFDQFLAMAADGKLRQVLPAPLIRLPQAGPQVFESPPPQLEVASAPDSSEDQWLPPSLLRQGVTNARAMLEAGDHFELHGTGFREELFCRRSDGAKLHGYFVVNEGRVIEVQVTLSPGPPAPATHSLSNPHAP